jgi:hypothetical protein
MGSVDDDADAHALVPAHTVLAQGLPAASTQRVRVKAGSSVDTRVSHSSFYSAIPNHQPPPAFSSP